MLTQFLLLAMASEPAAVAPPLLTDFGHFDLGKVKPSDPCTGGTGNEIVVCGRRIRPVVAIDGSQFAERPLRPRVNVLGGTADIHAEQHILPAGSVPAVMVTLKIPF